MQDKVEEFHRVFKTHIADKVGFPEMKIRAMRIRLLAEEMDEYITGEQTDNIVEVADGLADMLYIIFGTAVSYGIPLEKVFDEVHASNMSKLDANGNPIYREDGKILKGPNYFKPRIKEILDAEKE